VPRRDDGEEAAAGRDALGWAPVFFEVTETGERELEKKRAVNRAE